jgi:hypothetical protein
MSIRKLAVTKLVVVLGGIVPLVMVPVMPRPAMAQDLSGLVNQVSDLLVTRINSGTCQDFATLIGQVKDSANTPPDPNSTFTGLLNQVQASEPLKGIVVAKVGPAMVNRLLACNMVPVNALTSAPVAPK